MDISHDSPERSDSSMSSGVSKSFTGAAGDELLVLDSIDLQLRAGEIVALLGRSGPASRRSCASSPV